MENFIELLSEVWNRGFLGINLGSIISSLLVLFIVLLFRGFIISVIINSLSRLAENTESKIRFYCHPFHFVLDPVAVMIIIKYGLHRASSNLLASTKLC